jgi:tetratricopeptide (TPR) repeat protein
MAGFFRLLAQVLTPSAFESEPGGSDRDTRTAIMARNTPNLFGQPSLEDLMVRFLAARSDAAAAAVEPSEGEVEPHEVAAGFRVDPRAAWIDATMGNSTAPVPLPPDWATLANQPTSAFAVPLAAGNFPQRVRDLHPLLTKFNPAELLPSATQPPLPGLVGLRNWIRDNAAAKPVLAAGLARLIGDFDTADALLPADAANERAALLWQRGRCEDALAAWTALPEAPAVLFNRGMALLFLGKTAEAKTALAKTIAVLPEASGWNALARLYLALAEIHG